MRILSFLSIILLSGSLYAQDIAGRWNGVLKIQGTSLRVIFDIKKAEAGYTATMDSPDQGAIGIPVNKTTFQDGLLTLSAPNMALTYEGRLTDETIVGDFKQGGQTFPLTLSKKVTEKVKTPRPQTPVAPFPYYSEEVTFNNGSANVKLAGTLTLPQKEGNFPAVILITGSGPQDRDEKLFDHQPFLVLSDYLTRNGFAVLRYDDRGVAQSTGDFKNATTQDFATDVESAIAYLRTRKEINQKKIGLIGHSEGGMIAPMVAAQDKGVAFVVLLAAPGMPITELMLLQKEKIERQAGVSEKDLADAQSAFKGAYKLVLASSKNDNQLKTQLNNYFKEKLSGNVPDKDIATIVNQLTATWFYNFLKTDPSIYLTKVKVPVLALNGENDLQVSAKENLLGIQTVLAKAGNKNVTVKQFPGLNHLFQESKTGSPSEYGQIEQTISPIILTEVLNWLRLQVK
ncbi:alpha/beta hydrolase family protein [Pedobacter namyangjuensis]|uniref:alpha/beta hydrolase family protein n=1 Tax=Pedobacter namyangjuensis TaxID=600626 RepID=UPI000DE51936|nr:alpha/beta fold hydrolase [Pedobacter namyangjuensis]